VGSEASLGALDNDSPASMLFTEGGVYVGDMSSGVYHENNHDDAVRQEESPKNGRNSELLGLDDQVTKNCAQSNSKGSLPPKFELKKNLSLKENLKLEGATEDGQSDRINDRTSVLRADPPTDEELAKKPPLKRKPVLREKPLEGVIRAKVMEGLTLPEEEIKLDEKAAVRQSLERRLSIRPSIVELKERGLFPTESELNESRRRVSECLERRLSIRPTETELLDRNILRRTSEEERRNAKEETKNLLQRRLSYRPCVAELRKRRILQFSDYIEVGEVLDYDRGADKPWTRLTQGEKASIRRELNEFKSREMEVHEDSRHRTRFHKP